MSYSSDSPTDLTFHLYHSHKDKTAASCSDDQSHSRNTGQRTTSKRKSQDKQSQNAKKKAEQDAGETSGTTHKKSTQVVIRKKAIPDTWKQIPSPSRSNERMVANKQKH